MAIPTQPMWNALKKNAGISKSPWWKAADAAVGPALGKLDTAKKKWEAKNDYDSAGSYVVALFNVDKAFKKFITKKDLTAAGTFKTLEEAQDALCPDYRVIEPRAQSKPAYDALYPIYRDLYFAMGDPKSAALPVGGVLPQLRDIAARVNRT